MSKKVIILSAVLVLVSMFAITVLAEDGGSNSGSPTGVPPIRGAMQEKVSAKTTLSQADLTCVQSAVDAREQAIDSAFGTFSTSESAALSTRASALHDAWGMTDATARRTARNAAWTAYRTANRADFTTLRSAKKAAWAAFATASKACKVPVVESSDAEGAGSLGL